MDVNGTAHDRCASGHLLGRALFELSGVDRPIGHATGASSVVAMTAGHLVALVLVVSLRWRERATLPGGFILSPSATLRVAGLVPRVKVEHTTI